MANKVSVLLFFVALIVPILNAYPLEDDSSSSTETKAHPLLAGKYTGKNGETTDKNNETTEQGYIEETYIEVLLPGLPQLNTSSLNALLSNSSSKNTSSTTVTAESTTTEKDSKDRPVRDTSSSAESDEDKKSPSSFKASSGSTVTTPADNIDKKDSNEDSSEEKKHGLLTAQVSASPRPLSRAVREEEKENSSPATSSSTAEGVVFVTPQAKKLDTDQVSVVKN